MDGRVTTFGTTGYTHKRTFVLYDRATQSVWYPQEEGEMNGVSGANSGKSLPFIAKPDRMKLSEWRAEHPDSLVLIGAAAG